MGLSVFYVGSLGGIKTNECSPSILSPARYLINFV